MVFVLLWLAEMDINPLLVDDAGVIALDARVVADPRYAVVKPARSISPRLLARLTQLDYERERPSSRSTPAP